MPSRREGREIGAAQPGAERDVGEQQIEGRCTLERAERLLGARAGNDRASERAQKIEHHLAHIGIVLDQQDAHPAAHGALALGRVFDRQRGFGGGDIERDRRAGAERARDRDRALRLAHEAIDGAQAQAGAAAAFLGGEKRLEGALAHLVGHAAAVVGDRDRDEAPAVRAGLGFAVDIARQRVAGPGAKAQPAAARHRIARIDRDIEQRRFELAGVGQAGRAGRRIHVDPDMLVERAAQHVGQRMQQRIDVDRARLQQLAAREGEQLAGEFGAAPARPRGGRDELLRTVFAGEQRQFLEHLQIALDDGQQVVEIVRDAAGQLAHAFEPLRVVQRLFAARALQAGREQRRQRLHEARLLGAEALGLVRAHRQHTEDPSALGQRHRQRADQAGVEVGLRHAEAALGAEIVDDDRLALRQHEAGRRIGTVRNAFADRLAGDDTRARGDPKFERIAFEQEDLGSLDFERGGGDFRNAVEQLARVAGIEREPAELRQMFAVAGPAQRLAHARIGADIPDRGDHPRRPAVQQRAERDLDHHLAAILAPGDQRRLGAHRARARIAGIARPVGGMALAKRIRHQGIDR